MRRIVSLSVEASTDAWSDQYLIQSGVVSVGTGVGCSRAVRRLAWISKRVGSRSFAAELDYEQVESWFCLEGGDFRNQVTNCVARLFRFYLRKAHLGTFVLQSLRS